MSGLAAFVQLAQAMGNRNQDSANNSNPSTSTLFAEAAKGLTRMHELRLLARADMSKQAQKNLTRAPADRKRPYLSAEEYDRLKENEKKAHDAVATLHQVFLQEVPELEDKISGAVTDRQVAKRRKQMKHCDHCDGQEGACKCTHQCSRRMASRCTDARRHCEHCHGVGHWCACKEGCAKPSTARCAPRHCRHCDGSHGICTCGETCNRPDGIKCRERHCRHCSNISNSRCDCPFQCPRKDSTVCTPRTPTPVTVAASNSSSSVVVAKKKPAARPSASSNGEVYEDE